MSCPPPQAPSLLQRAEALLAGGVLATLALAPLDAAALASPTADDLVVEGSGAYFYNASGYFADWRGRPDGGTVNEVNADGSVKLYGSASATPEQFLAHNCSTDWGCSWYSDRGLSLVFWGTLRQPAQAGERLSLSYDFTIDVPDTGVEWVLRAQIGSWDFGQSNSLNGSGASRYGSFSEAGSQHLQGSFSSEVVQDWQVGEGSEPLRYWQVSLSATAHAPWSEGYWSDTHGQYLTPFRGLSITVPNQSLDVALLPAEVPAVLEPASYALWLAGLGLWLATRQRAR
ncbi:MAG: hypothetical protein KBC73_01115 [Burkholderiaceae bacterium]|nr:hypothetical protein [Burkholderiaceae bacterium]